MPISTAELLSRASTKRPATSISTAQLLGHVPRRMDGASGASCKREAQIASPPRLEVAAGSEPGGSGPLAPRAAQVGVAEGAVFPMGGVAMRTFRRCHEVNF